MKRILLDSHALLWSLADSPLLGTHARSLIADTRNRRFSRYLSR